MPVSDIDFDSTDDLAYARQSVEGVARRNAEVKLAAFGYYAISNRKLRVDAIKAKAKEVGVPAEYVEISKNILDAVCAALKAAQQGVRASVIGAIDDIETPGDVADRDLWCEAVLAFMEDHRISMQALDLDRDSYNKLRSAPMAVTIRRYNRIRHKLEDEIGKRFKELEVRKAPAGKKYGRPPYGYRIEKGALSIYRPQAEAVMLVFTRKRNGVAAQEIINELKEKFTYEDTRNGSRKRQHWDHVKLQRILDKAPLYCQGRYSVGEGTVVESRDLAFLPKEWVDTMPSNEQPAPASKG